MIKYVFNLFGFGILLSSGIVCGQVVVQINAGSRAPYGTNQDLYINANGKTSYYKGEINKPIKDSATFYISKSSLDSFFKKAEQVGFFNLNSKYDGGFADGAGIFISLNSSGKNHSVDLLNEDIPQINELIALLNSFLAPHKIRIYYGQK